MITAQTSHRAFNPGHVSNLQNFGTYKNGSPKFRFDMLVRWPENSKLIRMVNPFLYKGDRFNPTLDQARMLRNHISHFRKEHQNWLCCYLYDNFYNEADPMRVVIEFHNGKQKMLNHRLQDYEAMLTNVPLPDMLSIVRHI